MEKCIQDGRKCISRLISADQWPCRLCTEQGIVLRNYFKPESKRIPVEWTFLQGTEYHSEFVHITRELFDAMKKLHPDGIEVC